MPDVRRWIEALEAKTVENGCTPEEAEAAQAKAQELRAKHAIYGEIRPPRMVIRWTVYDNSSDLWSYVRGQWVPPHAYGTVVPEDDPDPHTLFTPEIPWWRR